MQNTTHIDEIQERDFHEWLPLWQAYQTFYQVDLGEEITNKTWKNFFNDDSTIHCIVAKHNQKIVGFAHFFIHPSTWSTQNYCYLEDLFVLPEMRSQHIGKKLIECIQNFAKINDCSRVYWHTQENNHTAQKLYNWVAENPGMIKYEIALNN